MHILVFPGWYPSRLDKFSGDFIQRHLQAISQYCKVTVFYAAKDKSIKTAEEIVVVEGNLTQVYHYYPSFSRRPKVDEALSFSYYNYQCVKAARRIHKQNPVTLVHLCVLQKNQLLGIWLKRRYNIPYVISEHSTFYIDGQFERIGFLHRQLLKHVFEKAESYHAVSQFLYKTLRAKLDLSKEGVVIPNVVNTELFYYDYTLEKGRVSFIHVSNMVEQKNVTGMLEAFAIVKDRGYDFTLNLVGPETSVVRDNVLARGLSRSVNIMGEKDYAEVAQLLQSSDAFVFFTRYETFGCVIIEANACGVPVIVSDLPVTRELINEGFSGEFVQSEDVKNLADKLVNFITNPARFDPIAISSQARSRFSYERVGEQFKNWYDELNNLHVTNA